MKFKQLLTKSLLVAVCLLAGQSAWGAKTVVGSLDNTTNWWSAFSDYYTIEPNSSLTLTFTNYSVGDISYQNWLGVLTNDVDRGGTGYSEYYVLRADGHKWGSVVEGNAYTYTCSDGIGMPSDNTEEKNGNSTLINALNGSNVILKIARSGATVTLRADFTATDGNEYFQQMVADCGDGTQNIRFFLSTEKGHIENLCEGAWNNVQTLDFENAETYTSGWTILSGANTPSQIGHKSGKALQIEADSKGSRDYYYNFATNTGFTNSPIWKIEFDFAGSTANTDPTRFYIFSEASGSSYGQFTSISKLFEINDGGGYKTTAKVYAGNDTETSLADLTYSSYKTAISTWYHITLVGNREENSVKLTIRNASDEIVLGETKVCNFVNAKGMSIRAGKGLGKIAIDDVKAYKLINPKVTTKYELSDGTTLIDAIETEVVAGSSYTPLYPTSFQSGTKQYTYVSGGDEIVSVTADMERTIIYSAEDMPTGTFYAETYEKSGGATGWSTSVGGRYDPVIAENGTNKYLTIKNTSNHNGANVNGIAWDGVVEENTDFTMSFDLQIDAATQSTSPLTFYDYANSGAMLKLETLANDGNSWKINDDADNPVTLSTGTWYTLTYSRKGSLTYLTIVKTSDDSEVLEQTQISTLSTNGGLGKVLYAAGRYNANIALDNVLIRAWQTGDTPEVTETTYTIKYRDEEGNEIKDDVENPTTVGTEDIVASSAETASFYNNDRSKKYIYKSGNNPITATATAASNVITLVFREAATYNYTVANNLGTVIASSTGFEQDEIVQPYPRYELKNGKMYTKGATGNEYRVRFTLSEDNQEENITGYADANIAGVVFCAEGESITGATVATEGTKSSRSSNGAVGQNPESAELTVLEGLAPGTYKICATFIKENSNSVTATFKVGEASYSATNSSNITNMASAETAEFTITETSDVTWTNNCNLDYVYIQRTAVSKTISSAGWATFCSPYALDLANATGLTGAYIVTGGENGVLTKTPVMNGTVPANTGLLLKGNEGTATIPVVAGSETNVANNILKGVTEATEIPAETGWVLMGSPKLGFYQNSNAFTVGANTAYILVKDLPVPQNQTTGARASYLLFDDMTGISQVAGSKVKTNGVIYNLNGQRVSNPTKGIYIIDGVKVAIE